MQEEFDEDSQAIDATFEVSESQIPKTATGQIDLVSLIDQPAWKTILISLVKSEKMDPWNISIIELADKYLQKINGLDGIDLRLPANAILASAILLRFKARILKLSSIDDDMAEAELAKQMSEEEKILFENVMPDLTSVRKFREGTVSLDSLVDAIEIMLEKTKSKSQQKQIIMDRPDFAIPVFEENIDEKMDFIYSMITDRADSEGLVLFSSLVEGKDVIGIVDTFIPVLFLANNEKVNIWQDEFFGEIFIALKKKREKAKN